jgi:hypothetical protein
MKSAAQVRAQVEAALGPSFPSPFALQERRSPELVLSGLAAVDPLTGGFPRSSLTEISGPPSSGRTTLELALLASLTTNGEACALIDAEDAFDPASAQAAGVVLDHLLWVRCHGLEQALRATDLLLGAGGFGAVILDLADVPARRTRRVPLSYWFRFRRAVENTPTVLALIDEEPCTQGAASLVLRLEAEGVEWSAAVESPVPNWLPHGRLLRELRWRAEVIRNRNSKHEIRNSRLEIQNTMEALTVSPLDLSCRPRLHDFRASRFDFQDPSFPARSRNNAQPRISSFGFRIPICGFQISNFKSRIPIINRQSPIGHEDDFRLPLHRRLSCSGCGAPRT